IVRWIDNTDVRPDDCSAMRAFRATTLSGWFTVPAALIIYIVWAAWALVLPPRLLGSVDRSFQLINATLFIAALAALFGGFIWLQLQSRPLECFLVLELFAVMASEAWLSLKVLVGLRSGELNSTPNETPLLPLVTADELPVLPKTVIIRLAISVFS